VVGGMKRSAEALKPAPLVFTVVSDDCAATMAGTLAAITAATCAIALHDRRLGVTVVRVPHVEWIPVAA
jgi:hypothetical protein